MDIFSTLVRRLWELFLLHALGIHPGTKINLTLAVWAQSQPNGCLFGFIEGYDRISDKDFVALLNCMERSIRNRGIKFSLNIGDNKFSFHTDKAGWTKLSETSRSCHTDVDAEKLYKFVEDARNLRRSLRQNYA